jgi:hypothetical protein
MLRFVAKWLKRLAISGSLGFASYSGNLPGTEDSSHSVLTQAEVADIVQKANHLYHLADQSITADDYFAAQDYLNQGDCLARKLSSSSSQFKLLLKRSVDLRDRLA